MTQAHQLRELVRVLVETPTPTGSEQALFPFLMDYLQAHEFTVTEQEVTERHPLTPPGEYRNLLARRGESRLLISAHLDTFPAYTHPQPYTLREEDDRLIARGVVDIKGQIAALLFAIAQTDAPCQIAFVCDEERGGTEKNGGWANTSSRLGNCWECGVATIPTCLCLWSLTSAPLWQAAIWRGSRKRFCSGSQQCRG